MAREKHSKRRVVEACSAGIAKHVAAQIAPEDVSERLPPLTLRNAREETSPSWQGTVDALLELADETGVEPRVFGSG